MTRKEELLEAVKNKPTLIKLVDEMVFLENRLEQLRALPMIKVDPENPERQKATPASKQHKDCLASYTLVVKTIEKAIGVDEADDSGPLRKWLNAHEVECR